MPNSLYSQCIEACYECAAACNKCASACLQEEHVHHMVACIQTDLECETICKATAELLCLNSKNVSDICTLCAEICRACAAECSRHKEEHCRKCAEACLKCADLCSKIVQGSAGIF